MSNLSQINAIVIDNGRFAEFACVLAREYGKVWYCPMYTEPYPTMKHGAIGTGMEGLTVVQKPWDVPFDKIDLWVFPTLGFGSMQADLVRQGARVFGARMGEEIELERCAVKEYLRKGGMEINPYVKLVGTKALREYLKKHDNVHVKTERWRADCESFKSTSYKESEPLVDEIEHNLGPFKYIFEFCVEDDLPDCVELGTDCISVDGQFPENTYCGIEVKDCGMVGSMMPWKDIPEPVTRVNRILSPLMKQYQYRAPFSTEVRIDKKLVPHPLDQTTRFPIPPNETYQELYANLPQMVWDAANGILTQSKPLAKFGCQVIMRSKGAWSDHNAIPFDIPDKWRRNIKLLYPVKIDGRYYTIPQNSEGGNVGSIVGWGDTLDAARKMCQKAAESVNAVTIKKPVEVLDEAEKEFEKAEKFGLRMLPKAGAS